jgi:hypothetical protein
MGGVLPALLLIKATDSTGPRVVAPMPSEHAVHLIDELQSQILEFFAPGLLIKAKKVADRESIGP